ncbi:deaminase [Stenotrophomonas sp. LM091]|nr:dihydrofolate reductase family protein [Stenotrophomonas sp. LM091]AOX61523.1 deaminase [Stenotrophomonas sp. LM091]
MTPHCSSFIAVSLDGCIARADGSLDWLDHANQSVPAGEDCGYAAYMVPIKAIVMGRRTLEKVLSFPEWPYADLPVYVLSHTLQAVPEAAPNSVRLHSGALSTLMEEAATRGLDRLYIDGGRTVQSFLAEGLLREITVTTIPVLVGGGLRLFGEAGAEALLTHRATVVYPFGFVQTRYAIGSAG